MDNDIDLVKEHLHEYQWILGQNNTIYYATISPAGQPIPSWEEGESKTYLESLSPPVHLLGEPDQFLSNTICTPFSRWESTQVFFLEYFKLKYKFISLPTSFIGIIYWHFWHIFKRHATFVHKILCAWYGLFFYSF